MITVMLSTCFHLERIPEITKDPEYLFVFDPYERFNDWVEISLIGERE